MLLRKSFVIVIFIILSSYSYPQTLVQAKYLEVADKIVKSALREQFGYELLRELCAIGPRLSGSENSMKAIHWAVKRMNYLGFDSVWLQPVMVPKWVRGNLEIAVITHSKFFNGKKLKIAAFGGSIATPKNGITAEVLEVKSFDELKSKSELAKGKIIFFNRELDLGELNTFAGYGSAVNQRTNGAIEASKYGAVGVIVRSITTKHDNVPHVGVMYYVDSLPKIPSVAIGFQDADFLSNVLKKEPNLKVTIKLNCKTLPDVESYNVIGELRGSEKSDEVVLIGGHFDSWDQGDGAHDDGAGCIQSIEVLNLFQRLNIKPKRTIRCVLFINEENGLRGGIEYGKYADTAKEFHVAAIESDRGGFTPRGFSVETDSITLNKIQSWLSILEKSGIDWVKRGGSGGDVAQIKNRKALIGYVPDAQRYMDVHHSANDVFESVHPREFELGSAAMAILSYLISEEGL